MRIFKSYLKILKKNSLGIIIYLVIFIALSILFTFKSANNESDKSININIAVINNSKDSFGNELKKHLGKSYNIVEIKDDKDVISESILTSYVDYVLKINEDNSLIKYSVDVSDYMINSKIYEFVQIKEIMSLGKNSSENTSKILGDNLKLKHYKQGDDAFKISESMYYYHNYLLFVILSIIIIGLYYSERLLQGNRILVSGTKLKDINKKLIASSIFYILSVWIIFMILFAISFGKEVVGNSTAYKYILSSFIYLIPASGIGYFIGSISKTREANMAMQNIVTMLFAFISNVFIPFEFLPDFLKKVAIISPMYWSNLVLKSILEGGFFEASTVLHMAIQVLIGLTLVLLSVFMRKNKSKNELV